MNTIFEILLSNVIVVSIGALVIYGITRVWNNARVSRVLWLILLLKLITPPLYQIPLLGPSPETESVTEEQFALIPVAYEELIPYQLQEVMIDTAERNVEQESAGVLSVLWESIGEAITFVNFMYLWIAGTCIWIVINIWQIYHLRRLVAGSYVPSKEAQDAIVGIAKSLRLKTIPKLRFVDSMISPCVWAWKRSSYILISKELFARMDKHQQQTILTHEMAHLRQGDHLLRWLELVIIAVYWWFPVAWWIVKQLHKSGEYCCDSYVYNIHPTKIKAYARALVETVECLSNTNKKVAVLGVRNLSGPMLLKKRIKLISEMKGQTKMNWKTKILAVLIAASTLMLSVGYACEKEVKADENKAAAEKVIQAVDSTELSDDIKAVIKATIEKSLAGKADGETQALCEISEINPKSMVHTSGKVIMIGPDGKKQEFDLNGKDIDISKMIGSKLGPVHVTSKAMKIGADGEMQEIKLDGSGIDVSKLISGLKGQPVSVTAKAMTIGPDGKMQEIDLSDLHAASCGVVEGCVAAEVDGDCAKVEVVDGKIFIVGKDGKKKELGPNDSDCVVSKTIKINADDVKMDSIGHGFGASVDGKIVVVGPDGKKQEIDLGNAGKTGLQTITINGKDLGVAHSGHAIGMPMAGKVVVVGPDGKKHEMDLGNSLKDLKPIHEKEASTKILEMQIKSLEKQIELMNKELEQLKSTIK